MKKGKTYELAIILIVSLICGIAVAKSDEDFVDNEDGTVTDLKSGLMWQKEDDNQLRDWQQALNYCNDLDLAGHQDWRLPNVKELASIVDSTRKYPATYSVFVGTNSTENSLSTYEDLYYSSTHRKDNGYVWVIRFQEGQIITRGKNDTGAHFLTRCVRGGLASE